jgi:hypothetical protein
MRTTRWLGGIVAAMALAAIAGSCGGTGGGGGGGDGTPQPQFILNSNNSGRLILNVNPGTVDANKSDRIGLVAQLTDSQGHGISGVAVTFTSEIDDIEFIPNQVDENGENSGTVVTDANGRADIIAIAGSSPTGTGEIIGTGAIFATVPASFGLRAQTQVTLTDVGFIDADQLSVIPSGINLVEPGPGDVIFFTIVGGTPPYFLTNEVSGIGTAAIGQRCLPGCTENGGILCVGSPCQSDNDCNLNGSASPGGVCLGEIKHCIASCQGTNCGGARCSTDADCNDGSPTPASVCQDSGQSMVYIINNDPAAGTHGFIVHDSAGASVVVDVTVTFVCGNGVARGNEQCDLGDLRDTTCEDLGRPPGQLVCGTDCTFDTTGCVVATPGGGGSPSPGGSTATPGGGGTSTPTPTLAGPTPTATGPTATPTPGVGVASNLTLALLVNLGGDNGNGTATTVAAATVTDINGNAVPTGTQVTFTLLPLDATAAGSLISSPSQTNMSPPCDPTNFQSATGVTVLTQPGVAHACITYPVGAVGGQVQVGGSSGAGFDAQPFTLPAVVPPPTPTPTATP